MFCCVLTPTGLELILHINVATFALIIFQYIAHQAGVVALFDFYFERKMHVEVTEGDKSSSILTCLVGLVTTKDMSWQHFVFQFEIKAEPKKF